MDAVQAESKNTEMINAFNTKLIQIIIQSRISAALSPQSQEIDSWFGMLLKDHVVLSNEETSIFTDVKNFCIDIFYSKGKEEKKLETWSIINNDSKTDTWTGKSETDLQRAYKKKIGIFFRTLYIYLRTGPAYRFSRECRRYVGKELKVSYKIRQSKSTSEYKYLEGFKMKKFEFQELNTLKGSLQVSSEYIDDIEFKKLTETSISTDLIHDYTNEIKNETKNEPNKTSPTKISPSSLGKPIAISPKSNFPSSLPSPSNTSAKIFTNTPSTPKLPIILPSPSPSNATNQNPFATSPPINVIGSNITSLSIIPRKSSRPKPMLISPFKLESSTSSSSLIESTPPNGVFFQTISTPQLSSETLVSSSSTSSELLEDTLGSSQDKHNEVGKLISYINNPPNLKMFQPLEISQLPISEFLLELQKFENSLK